MASHEEDASFNNPDNFCDRMRYYWLNHKKHMLIFLISIIIGVSVGVGLNFGFNLSGGNLVVHRTFKQNQAMQYGRVLSYCMDIKGNTTHPPTDNATEQCNIEKSMITFYVANVTENGFSIICQINDHQSFAVTNAMLNTSNLSSLSYNGKMKKI